MIAHRRISVNLFNFKRITPANITRPPVGQRAGASTLNTQPLWRLGHPARLDLLATWQAECLGHESLPAVLARYASVQADLRALREGSRSALPGQPRVIGCTGWGASHYHQQLAQARPTVRIRRARMPPLCVRVCVCVCGG